MPIERLHEIWPEWSVQEQIGEGSFGKVYKAVHIEQGISAYAAIKVIPIPKSRSEIDSIRSEGLGMDGTRTYFQSIVNDFANEIKLMHSLKGIQNIVSVEDFRVVEKADEIGWDIFIRMELLTPFNAYISDKKLSEEDVIKLGIDICTALEICSKRNIIHRDIKPENIFVNDFGYFKLGDFGIARKLENMTDGLSQKGTVNYMAPEVANGRKYDSRVDTYSLGIVLYRLLNNNRLPFLDTQKQILNHNERRIAVERRMSGEHLPPPCEASSEMADLILKACAYDPDQRFASASEMKKTLMLLKDKYYSTIQLKPIISGSKEAASDAPRKDEALIKTTRVRRAENESVVANEAVLSGKENQAKKNETKDSEEVVLVQQAASGAGETVAARKPEGREAKDKPIVASDAILLNEENDANAKETSTLNETVAVRHTDVKADKTVAARKPEQRKVRQVKNESVTADASGLSAEVNQASESIVQNLKETVAVRQKRAENDGTVAARRPKERNIKQNKPSSTHKVRIAVISAVICLCILAGAFVLVQMNRFTEIMVTSLPNKTSYFEGDTVDLSGLVVSVKNGLGISKVLHGDYFVEGMDALKVGENKIIIRHNDLTTDFIVNAEAIEVVSISIGSVPKKTDYYVGDTLDTTGLTLTATYNNGTIKTISNGFTCSPTNFAYEHDGTRTVTVTYDGKKATFGVKCKENKVEIAIKSYPYKMSYYILETLDTSGLTLIATYSDGSTKTISSGFICSPMKFTSEGTKKITVTYKGKTTSFNVTVEQKKFYFEDGSYYVFEYDDNGDYVREVFYKSDGTMDCYSVSEHNSQGKVTKQTDYYPDGTIMTIIEREFDSKGNVSKSTWYNPDGTIRYIYEYDSDGNVKRIK